MRPVILYILLSIFQLSNLYAQEVRFEKFGPEHGLSDPNVKSITQDKQGFLWFGTVNGLNRYDGYTFTSYWHNPLDSTSVGGNRINALHGDRLGYVWVSHESGLDRYDPVTDTFTYYRHDPDDSTTISGHTIYTIYETRDGTIWIGTWRDGLNRYNRETDSFIRYNHDPDDPTSLSHPSVATIYEDQSGTLWVGTNLFFTDQQIGGLDRFDPLTQSFVRFTRDPADPSSLGANAVQAIVEDSKGMLWAGTNNGLYQLEDREQGQFARFDYDPDANTQNVVFLHEDQDGKIWIGDFEGVVLYDPGKDELTRYEPDLNDPFSLVSVFMWRIYEDDSGTIWICCGSGSCFEKVKPTQGGFEIIQENQEGTGLKGKSVFSLAEDNDHNIWLGTEQGLNRWDSFNNVFVHYEHNPDDPKSIGPGTVRSVIQTEDKSIWAGTWLPNGNVETLNRFDPETKFFYRYVHDPNDKTSLSRGVYNVLYEDQHNVLWVGSSEGLNQFDRTSNSYIRYTHDPEDPTSISHNTIRALVEDRQGSLWVGTHNGLNRYDDKQDQFERFLIDSVSINELVPDGRGRLWIGTRDQGLLLFDPQDGIIEQINKDDGLPGNRVLNAIFDNTNNLWVQTTNGLAKLSVEEDFSPDNTSKTNSTDQSHELTLFTHEDGLLINSASLARNALMRANGRLLFAGHGGVVSFLPDQFAAKSIKPPDMALTSFKLFDEEIKPGEESLLAAPLWQTNKISLTHDQHTFSISFVGLHYKNPQKNTHRYRLEPYDVAWRIAGNEREASYHKVSPGAYTFQVAASNSDGVWSEPVSLAITILPPWYRTIAAFVVYGLLFVVGIAGVDRFQRRRLIAKERLRAEREKAQAIASTNTELERALKHLTETQDQLIHTEKMASLGQLTAGVAHEIKNPLNFVNNFAQLCVGQAEDIEEVLEKYRDNMTTEDAHELKSMFDDLKVNASKINEHGHRADGIIRSMLEHSRAEAGEKRPVDINQLLDEYVNLSYHAVRARTDGEEVTITRDYAKDLPEVHLVPQEIGRVFINLLDNAFYAIKEKSEVRSPKSKVDRREQSANLDENPSDFGLRTSDSYHPEVKVTTRMNGTSVQLSIQDNGTGIPAAIQSKIFEPFFTTKPTGSGTGLGLSLSYDIVTQGHGGSLSVESEEGEGATFILTLPV